MSQMTSSRWKESDELSCAVTRYGPRASCQRKLLNTPWMAFLISFYKRNVHSSEKRGRNKISAASTLEITFTGYRRGIDRRKRERERERETDEGSSSFEKLLQRREFNRALVVRSPLATITLTCTYANHRGMALWRITFPSGRQRRRVGGRPLWKQHHCPSIDTQIFHSTGTNYSHWGKPWLGFNRGHSYKLKDNR